VLGVINQISAASGVAYTERRGATTLSNWTDVGPKAFVTRLGQRRRPRHMASHRRNVQAAHEPATLRLTAEAEKNLSPLSVAYEKF